MCMLELEGRPIDNLGDASNLLQQVIQQHTREFTTKATTTTTTTTTSSSSLQTKADDSFPFGSFQLIPDATVDKSPLGKLQYKALQGWDKLTRLSSFQAGPFRFGL